MSETLPISAIITHCNRPELLECAIASIRRQTAQPAEIIVVDDCSRPEYRPVLEKLSAGVRMIYLDKSRRAPGARNAGIAVATQPWIAFLDDDDEWLPGKLERQWKILQGDASLSAVISALTVVSSEREPWTMTSHSPDIMTLGAALEDNLAMLQSAVIRTADIRSLGGLDVTLPVLDDQDFWIRFTAAGYRGYCDREPLVLLNRRRMKRLSTFWWGFITSQFRIIEKHRALYISRGGRRTVHRARAKSICRAGLDRGKIVGRVLYAGGCIFGGDIPRLVRLVTTGKMQIIPYTQV
jgi:glycosyltransferase involved in cell wall biosynthesis